MSNSSILKIALFCLIFLFKTNVYSQTVNWNDTLQSVLSSKLSDSTKVAELGKKIIYLVTNKKPEAPDYLQAMGVIASKNKSPNLFAELYYSKAVVGGFSLPAETYFKYIDSCLYYAVKAQNIPFQIRSYRMKGQYYLKIGKTEESKPLLEKALDLCDLINNPFEAYRTSLAMATLYEKRSDYKNSIRYSLQAAEIADKNKMNSTLSSLYLQIAKVYDRISDDDNALTYFKKAEAFSTIHQQTLLPEIYTSLGNFYQTRKKNDEAFLYYMKSDSLMKAHQNFESALSVYSNIATLYTLKGELDSSQRYFEKSIQFAEGRNYQFIGRIYLNYATFLIKKKEFTLALEYAEKAIAEVKNKNDKDAYSEVLQVKAEALVNLKQLDEAISVYQSSLSAKDSIHEILKNESLGELLAKYESDKKENEISKLNSDKQIQKLQLEKQKAEISGNKLLAKQKQQEIDLLNQKQEIQELKLSQQKEAIAIQMLESESKDRTIKIAEQENQIKEREINQQKFTKNILFGGFIALFLFILLAFNNYRIRMHRKNDKEKYLLQNQLVEMKLEALRSQMNPHFIFNALNSINRYIIRNSKETASEYLIKFSKLVRSILENSKSKTITLEQEIEAVQLYVELELLRFDHKFDFRVNIDESINKEASQIPPLVLQPFIENAIWHGLMKKEERGQITIDIKSKGSNTLFIAIEDNGVGREAANKNKSTLHEKGKSFGMQITEERINALNNKKNTIKIIDLYDSEKNAMGTRVEFELTTIAA
jgi:tetratricopeptide (TPR) repeat protein